MGGTDEFPSCVTWADEHEAWLRFAKETGGFAFMGWEPLGADSKRGEFLVGAPPVFVEVKSPGWEDEIAKAERRDSPRLQEPEYTSTPRRARPGYGRPSRREKGVPDDARHAADATRDQRRSHAFCFALCFSELRIRNQRFLRSSNRIRTPAFIDSYSC